MDIWDFNIVFQTTSTFVTSPPQEAVSYIVWQIQLLGSPQFHSETSAFL